jgi:hypothetical protein
MQYLHVPATEVLLLQQLLLKQLRPQLRLVLLLLSLEPEEPDDAEERLEGKLKRVDATDACVRQLLELGPTPALGALTAPARAYLDSVYASADLEAEYNTLIQRYKRFAVLKGLVTLGGIQQTPAPVCTICMTKEITHATIPCGHTYCEECSRTQVTSCYICRVQVRDRVRLFFS